MLPTKVNRSRPMPSVTHRKKTDSGYPIPPWAARGWFRCRQGGLDGPIDRQIDIRCDSHDGEVTLFYTGPDYECFDHFDEIETGNFHVAQGLRGLLELGTEGCCPPMESCIKPTAQFSCSDAFDNADSALIRYFWNEDVTKEHKHLLLQLPLSVLRKLASITDDLTGLPIADAAQDAPAGPCEFFNWLLNACPALDDHLDYADDDLEQLLEDELTLYHEYCAGITPGAKKRTVKPPLTTTLIDELQHAAGHRIRTAAFELKQSEDDLKSLFALQETLTVARRIQRDGHSRGELPSDAIQIGTAFLPPVRKAADTVTALRLWLLLEGPDNGNWIPTTYATHKRLDALIPKYGRSIDGPINGIAYHRFFETHRDLPFEWLAFLWLLNGNPKEQLAAIDHSARGATALVKLTYEHVLAKATNADWVQQHQLSFRRGPGCPAARSMLDVFPAKIRDKEREQEVQPDGATLERARRDEIKAALARDSDLLEASTQLLSEAGIEWTLSERHKTLEYVVLSTADRILSRRDREEGL